MATGLLIGALTVGPETGPGLQAAAIIAARATQTTAHEPCGLLQTVTT